MFGKFSRRHFAKLAGLSALGIAARAGRRRRASRSRAAGACEFSERLRVGHRHLGLSDRGRGERRRPRPLDLGYVRAHARQDRGQDHRRFRQRSLPPLQGRHRPDPGIGRQGLPVFDRVAAGVSGRNGQAEPQGPRLLRPPHRRVAQARHRAVRDALSLGSAAGARGQGRRLAIQRNVESIRRLCRPRGGAYQRSRQVDLHDQRSRKVREFRLWMGRRCPRPQTAGRGSQPGPPPCGAGAWPRRAGDPRAWARGHQSGSGRKHRGLRAGIRHAGKRSRRRDRDARIELWLPRRDSGRQVHRRVSAVRRPGRAEIHR